ncbi:MAG: flagellar protein FlbB [Treponema sp.]|nr:flagellar protein FlbB [Treponema sp.]
MARARNFGKSLLLLLLIIILVLFGLLWFDFLGVIQAKSMFAPVYRLLHLQPQTSTSATAKDFVMADLDNDRFAKRLESLNIRVEELDKREEDIRVQEENNALVAQELQDRETAQNEREKTFNNRVKQYDDRDRNIEQIVRNLNGMQPARAVAILNEMNDQDVIDVLRRAEEDAKASGGSSMGAYWLSLMPAARAAELQRKMANKPLSLD